jgi:hypothetical protein
MNSIGNAGSKYSTIENPELGSTGGSGSDRFWRNIFRICLYSYRETLFQQPICVQWFEPETFQMWNSSAKRLTQRRPEIPDCYKQ